MTREAFIEPGLNAITLACTNKQCMLRVRIGRIINKPSLRVGMFEYCPLCGSNNAKVHQDMDESYWDALANAYKIPAEIMKMLYDTWNAKEHPIFADYVKQMREEARQ